MKQKIDNVKYGLCLILIIKTMLPVSNNDRKGRPDRYKKGNKLGNGVSGSVYLGIDEETSQYVAIKAVKLSEIDNEVKSYLLKSQTNALVGLHHPNIVRCLDIVQTDEECLFIMEYCPDGTLNDLIKKRGKIPESQALAILRGIVSGYKECIQAGVVHRDLKPTNILMVHNIPKITDFGFCQINGSRKPKMYYNVGSPSYMSPEAYMDNIYGQKSDVWSIGMIFYELLLGRTLLQDKQKLEDLYRYLGHGNRFIPNGISDLSKNVLLSCLKYNYSQRIGIVELDQVLAKALGPNPVQMSVPSLPQQMPAPQMNPTQMPPAQPSPQITPHTNQQQGPHVTQQGPQGPLPGPAPNSMPNNSINPMPGGPVPNMMTNSLPNLPPSMMTQPSMAQLPSTLPGPGPMPRPSVHPSDPRKSNFPKPFSPMPTSVNPFPSMGNLPGPSRPHNFLNDIQRVQMPPPSQYFRTSNSPDFRKKMPLTFESDSWAARQNMRGALSIPKNIRPLAPRNMPSPMPPQVQKQNPALFDGRRQLQQPIQLGNIRQPPPPPMFNMPMNSQPHPYLFR